MRKVSLHARQHLALFCWPFPEALSTREMEMRLFYLGHILAFCKQLSYILSFSSLTVSCPSPESAQGRLLMVRKLFSQVSEYFTVMINKFSQLVVSKQFLTEILFLTGNNARHLFIVDLLV